MSNLRVKCHPTLGILVCTDGHVMVPANGPNKAHWTFGYKHSNGYRTVRIDGKDYRVHCLVAQTFIPNPENKPQVDHISRQKDQNSVDNLRWATSNENRCNRADHDRVTERGGTHKYEDANKAARENCARYRAEHPEKERERQSRYYSENLDKERERHARYRRDKRKTHHRVKFSDGTHHYVPNADAILLLAIPLKERHYHGK